MDTRHKTERLSTASDSQHRQLCLVERSTLRPTLDVTEAWRRLPAQTGPSAQGHCRMNRSPPGEEVCGILPGRSLRWNSDVTQCFLSCPAPTDQGLSLGPGSCGRAQDPAKGQRQWASAWGQRILASLAGALRAGQVDVGGDGGSGEQKTLELSFTAQPVHLAPGERPEAEPRGGVKRARAAGLCVKRNAGIQLEKNLQSPAPHLPGLPDLHIKRGDGTVQTTSPTWKSYLDS